VTQHSESGRPAGRAACPVAGLVLAGALAAGMLSPCTWAAGPAAGAVAGAATGAGPASEPTPRPTPRPATGSATGGAPGGPGQPAAPASGPAAWKKAPSAAAETAALQRSNEAALRRLEAAVAERLNAGDGRGRVRWREAVLPPDPDYLVWSPRTLRSPTRDESWRLAVDIRTRWYYAARVQGRGRPVFVGPLDETRPGVFADVLRAAPAR
jgi:hypothetical protein